MLLSLVASLSAFADEPAVPITPLPVEMHLRFALLLDARLAVQAKDMELVHKKANELVELEPPAGLQEPWRPYVAELKKDAVALAEAKNTGKASKAVAQLALTCASCHQEMGGGPMIPSLRSLSPEAQLVAAPDILWLSLLKGSDEGWSMGAEVLGMKDESDPELRAKAYAKLLAR